MTVFNIVHGVYPFTLYMYTLYMSENKLFVIVIVILNEEPNDARLIIMYMLFCLSQFVSIYSIL